MIEFESQVRVRYAETDQMGYVYYGQYATYFEVGRTDLIRSLGIPYKTLEQSGVMMPVADLQIQFKRPGRYDDLLTVKTIVPELPRASFMTLYEVRNEAGELVVSGKVRLAFIDMERMRPIRVPSIVLEAVKAHWPSEQG